MKLSGACGGSEQFMTAGREATVAASRWTILMSAEVFLEKGDSESEEDDREAERERLRPMFS